MKKILIGGIVGGIVVFAWGAVAHMVLPLGKMGIRQMPNEDAVLGAMKQSIREPGLYFFPGMDMSREPSQEERQAWTARYAAGPVGILIYHPQGETPVSPKQLSTQLATDIAAALIAAILLSQTGAGFLGRVLFVALLGPFSWVTISVPHWNWYGFPSDFTTGEAIDQVVGWFLGGLALAAIVKKPAG